MPGPDHSLFLASAANGLLAYGPGPPVDLIPYFVGLLTWAGLAFFSVLLWPLSALLRRIRGVRRAPAAGPDRAAADEPPGESAGKGSHDPV